MSQKDSSEIALENGLTPDMEDIGKSGPEKEALDYLQLTSGAYKNSTDYMTSNLRFQWERNIANFKSRHPQGSKYRTDAFKHRSRLFRPKTRTSIRNKEAAIAIALFSTSDAVSISAVNQADDEAVIGARVMKEVLNIRLQDYIPWFLLSIGAFQDANVIGSAIFHEYWNYQTRTELIPEEYEDEEDGDLVVKTRNKKKKIVVKDQPAIELVENENFRIHPAASWLDPINTTPYIIHVLPMYVIDVKKKMESDDDKTGQPAWKKLDIQGILRGNTTEQESNSTRMAREAPRQDPKSDSFTDISEHQIVWVYRVIMDIPGKGDMLWYTLGSYAMLSDPVPLKEAYWHGKRPYSLGNSVIEAHVLHPSGTAELGQDVQAATNENQNLRFDNIKQGINKRFLARRGATIDLRSLRRNVSGSITMTGDPEKDVKELKTSDVTQSTFQEQNLFNQDFDDVTGGFSPSTMQASKELNSNSGLGTMRMLKEPSNVITEYSIRIFAETLLTSCMKHLVELEKKYETDEIIMTAAGKAAKIDREVDEELIISIFQKDYKVKVNLGFGVTDPQARIGRLSAGFETIAKYAPGAVAKIKEEEVINEVFGILGFQDGSRFIMDPDEHKKFVEENPPGMNEVMAKIESVEKMKAAELELTRMVETEKIMSAERKELAKLQLEYGKARVGEVTDFGKKEIELGKLSLEDKKLEYGREDSLRKDSEIPSKEPATIDRSKGQ